MGGIVRNKIQAILDPLRLKLARPDALTPMAILGLVAGIFASALVTALRLALESLQIYFLGLPSPGEYSALPLAWRFFLPAIGGITLGLVLFYLPKVIRSVGVGYVIIRFHRFEADLPWRNALVQFFSAVWALLVGLSGGREGPGIHLGATGGSWIGRFLDLPHNSVRTLVGCGAAAAIAASFNTPLAAVIFTLELIVRQYTLATFIPIMLAASAGALFSTMFFGTNPAFDIQLMHNLALWEVPILIGMGLVIGAFAASYIHITDVSIRRTWDWPIWVRYGIIGVITGLIGLLLPQVMSLSYESVGLAAGAKFALWLMVFMMLAKLLLSALTFGFGLPLGPIGSTLVVGGFTGSALGMFLLNVTQIPVSDVAFYTVLGMGAMMGATLQAPLAALTAVIELTGDTGAIMPAMLTIIIASLTSRTVFHKDGIYDTVLRANAHQMRGLSLWHNANDIAISSIINRNFTETAAQCPVSYLQELKTTAPEWLVVRDEARQPIGVISGYELNRFLAALPTSNPPEEVLSGDVLSEDGLSENILPDDGEIQAPSPVEATPDEQKPDERMVDLTAELSMIPAKAVDIGLTLIEARELMRTNKVDVLIGQRTTVPPFKRTFGVLTRSSLEEQA
jgi:chloride channel protein, CIC family